MNVLAIVIIIIVTKGTKIQVKSFSKRSIFYIGEAMIPNTSLVIALRVIAQGCRSKN
jgi:hypothetical protein